MHGARMATTVVATVASNMSSYDADSPPPSPHTTPRPRRYPSHLSRLPPASSIRRGEPPLHRRGMSKTYESLEDLLTAAGYKETRIFTPENERLDSRDYSAQSKGSRSGDKRASSQTDSGVGAMVSNFISAWIPGASVSLGRAKGAELARGVVLEEDETLTTPPSPLAHRARPKLQTSGSSSTLRVQRSRQTIPEDFIQASRDSPSSSAMASLRAHNITPIAPTSSPQTPRPSRLRHIHSTPHMSRAYLKKEPPPQSWLETLVTGVLSGSSGKSSSKESRGRPARSHNVPRSTKLQNSANNLADPHPVKRAFTSPNPPTSYHPFPPQSKAPNALRPILHTDAVVCRSRPSSRSASRTRNQSQDEIVPVLSPSLSEDGTDSAMWALEEAKLQQRSHSNSRDDSDDDDSEEEEEMDIGPNLESIVSSYKQSQLLFPTNQHLSLITNPSVTNENIARRQRSIRSLRALLVPRPQGPNTKSDNPIFVVASPRSAEQGLPGRALWLDGPEWDGAAGKGKGAKKRGLIPWFGGEDVVTGSFRGSGDAEE